MITPMYTVFGKSYKKTFPIQPEYQAVLDRATALGYTLPDSEQQRLDNNKVYYLKLLNLWNEIDLLYLFKRSSVQSNFSTLNFKNPLLHQLTSLAVPTFEDNLGWRGNGTSTYWNSNYTPTLHAVKALPSDCSVFYEAYGTQNAGSAFWGTRNSSGNNFDHSSSGSVLHGPSVAATGGIGAGGLPAIGLLVKNGTTANRYRNGVFYNTATYTSTTLSSHPLIFLARNLNGTIAQFGTVGMSCFGLGSKNLEAHQLDIYKIINNTYE